MLDYKKIFQPYISHVDRNNNMSIVRYILALGVLISHFNILCGANIPWIVTNFDRVGGFFTLSGFLLAGPILKGLSFKDFTLKRIWRICPSYYFVIFLSAFVLCVFSIYPPNEYFSSSGFVEYLLANSAFLNFLHPDLPGVFQNLEINAVNGALWTMKVEWQLTLSLPLLVWLIAKFKLNFRNILYLLIILSLIYRVLFHWLLDTTEKPIYEILGRQFIGQSQYFLSGVLIYTYYEEFKRKKWLFTISSLIIYIAFRFFVTMPYYYEICHPFVISALVMGVALIPHDIASYVDGGKNISYEIYLWHFPVFQVFATCGIKNHLGVPVTFALGLFIVIILAITTYAMVGHLYVSRNRKLRTT